MKSAAASVLILCLAVAGPTARSAGPLHFTDRTGPAGFDLSPDIGGHHGSFIADYDNDGDEDIFMTVHGISQDDDTGWNALFRNRGDGIFDEVAGSLRLAGQTGGATPVAGLEIYGRFTHELHGAAWFDFDNDGDLDLYEPDTDSNKPVPGPGRHGYDELYQNNGDGTFTRVSTQQGFAPIDYARRGAVALDIDRDGFLDLAILQMIEITLDPDNPYSSTHFIPSPYRSVYFNQGGRFCREGTAGCRPATGIQHTGWSQGMTTIDYDLDGDVDILEASEFNRDGLRLWENDAAGHFQNVAAARGLPGPGASLNCVVTGDIDNDGDSDVYTWFDDNGTRAGRLYRNEIECRTDIQTGCTPASKGKRFTLVNASLGGAEHMFFGDLDNDGDLDLVSGGLFLNNGNGTFVADATTGLVARGRGGMVLDADGDGDLDVVMNHDDRNHPYRGFYRNDLSNGLNYLKVKLTGRGGQAGAPGARVWVYEEGFLDDPLHLLGYREVVTATGGFVNGPSPIQHFGLGNRFAVDVRAIFVTGETVVQASVAANTQVHLQVTDTDTTPPTISAVTAGNLTPTSARITWTTNEAADSQVEYGLTTSYGNASTLDTALLTSHAVNLTGLTAGTLYHYRVRSRDAAGNLATAGDTAFATASSTVSVDLTAEADTHVYQVNPTTNYGTAASVAVGGSPFTREIFIRFNLSGLPAGAVVTDGRLLVVASNGSGAVGGGGTIRRFAPAVAQWNETQPTWNAPLAGSDASGDLATLGPVSVGGSYAFANLASALAGNGRATFVIRSEQEDGAAYYSKEHAVASQRPVLRVTYVVGANLPPTVSAGPDQTVALPASAVLDGTVSDDGLPNPPGAVTTRWTQVSGPAPVVFANAASVDTTASFSAAGSYLLRLAASDGALTASDEVSLTVNAAPVPLSISLYGVFERTFNQAGNYSNAYVAVSATATLAAPDGRALALPLFWDGAGTWTVRFSPDAPGIWSWRIDSSDAGLNGQAGSFEVGPASGRGGIRQRPASRYHFERQDGTPFWWMGDTQWRAFGSDAAEGLNRSSVLHYLDMRSAQGFNYVHASLMSPGQNEGGDVFLSIPDETLNPAYFREVDTRVRYMNARRITAGIVLAWGSGSPSWETFTSDQARLRYARYVVARYSAYDVVFIVAGEWNEAAVPKSTYLAIGREIDGADPHGRLIGIHSTGVVEDFADETWMSFGDYQQVYPTLHQDILVARDHNKPVVNGEYAYYLRDQDGDGVVDKPNSATLVAIRNATWDIAMAGGYFVTGWGTTYLGGLRDAGPFNPDDPRNDDWEEDVQHVRTLFTGVEWWSLEPADALLTGSGTHYGLARTGQQYVAYVRNASGPLSLSLGGGAAATYAVRRFDPRTGASLALSEYSGSGPVILTPPDGQDWVFVLTQTGPPVNQAPTVDAGPNRAVILPATASLDGTVSDDGLPGPPETLASTWTQVSGPGTATFTDPAAVDTTARFSSPGTYVLRLTASDGALSGSDEVSVAVSASAPVTVSFGPEADTYVYQVNPTTNYGRDASMAVGGSPFTREIFIRFNLIGLPAGAVITDGQLSVVASNRSGAVGGGGTIRRFAPAVTEWNETQPTWNAPLPGSDASSDLATLGPVFIDNSYAFTNLASALAANERVTFVIRSGQEDGAAYYSKEQGVASQRPVLRVRYVVATN